MTVKAYRAMLAENRTPYMVETGESFQFDGRITYNSPGKIASFIMDQIGIGRAAEEYMYIICFDSKLRITGLFQASHGGISGTAAPVREIFQKALLLGAVNIAITHNHPSGDPTPSQEDIETTKRIKSAGEIIGINALDHVIVGVGRYYSFQENGCM